jgi:hypothetical protein
MHPEAIIGRNQGTAVDAPYKTTSGGVDDATLADAFEPMRDVQQREGAAACERIEQDVALEQLPVRCLLDDPLLPGAFTRC